jgi:RNA polymerase sigma-70 factor, ECF subfamily
MLSKLQLAEVHASTVPPVRSRRLTRRPGRTAQVASAPEVTTGMNTTSAAWPAISSDRPTLVDDAALVREAQQGDRAAFEELVHRFDGAVLRLALHLMGSEHEAQDVYQDAFLRAYRNLPRFRFECSFYTWMYRIVTNLCLDRLRNRRSRREDSSVVLNSEGEERDLLHYVADSHPSSDPERQLRQQEICRRVAQALRKLTPRERLVFELKHYQGLKLRTLGEILDTTEETIKSTLFRATQKLRKILADVR